MSNQIETVVCNHCKKVVDSMSAYRREEIDTTDGLPGVWVYWLCVDCKDVEPDQVAAEYEPSRGPDDDPHAKPNTARADAETVKQREAALDVSALSPMGLSLARGHYVLCLTYVDDDKLQQHFNATGCPLAGQELINRGYTVWQAFLARNWNDATTQSVKATDNALNEKYDKVVNLLDRIVSEAAESKKYRTMRSPSFTQELNAALEAANHFLQSLRNDHGKTE